MGAAFGGVTDRITIIDTMLVLKRAILATVAVVAICSAVRATVSVTDPASEVVRVRARLTTSARRAELSLGTGTVVSARSAVMSGAAATGTFDAQACHAENASTREIEIDCQWLVTNLPADGLADWTVTLEPESESVIEIYNVNDGQRPRLVDRLTERTGQISFSSPVSFLRDGGPLPVGSAGVPRVLAFYYPWYLHSTWTDDPLLKDHSPSRYSTDQQPDVNAEFAEARRAGLDGLVMSWNGVNRPFRLALAAARETGLLASTLLETDASREGGRKRNPIDPNIMQGWIADIVDMYGSDPAFLKTGGRPVIFVYAAQLIDPPTWRTIMMNIRASGRNPLVMGEGTDAAWLDALDGEFLYAPASMSNDDLVKFDLIQSLRVRTFHLLPRPSTSARRIWAATVSPGYDDRLIPTRQPPLFRDRANGAYYDTQWKAALAARPDWVMVTSWNEWYENTHIETSELYGDFYVRRTAAWARRYRCDMNPPQSTTKSDLRCDDSPADGLPR